MADPGRVRRGRLRSGADVHRGAHQHRPQTEQAQAVGHVGAGTAAVRLLGLDPLRVAAVSADAARAAEPMLAAALVAAADALAADDPDLLPADGSPLSDVLAQLHHRSEATLFAS